MKFNKIAALTLVSLMMLSPIQADAKSNDDQASIMQISEELWDQIDNNTKVVADKTDTDTKKITVNANSNINTSLAASTKEVGEYPSRKGVILVTKDAYKGLIPTGHAAIVISKSKVCEALSKGVVEGKNNWATAKKTCYGVSVKGTTAAQDEAAADWCLKQKGKKYNYNYYSTDTRKKFYCSQLVWASFKDLYGIDLNTNTFDLYVMNKKTAIAIHPAELISTSKTATIYEK